MRLHNLAIALIAATPAPLLAQQTAPATTCASQNPFAGPTYKSVEVGADQRVTFRLCAPEAKVVRLTSPDLYDNVPQPFPSGPGPRPAWR